MVYLAIPTAKFPNKRLIVEEEFLAQLVEAVNQLNEHAEGVQTSLDNMSREINRIRGDVERSLEAETAERVAEIAAISDTVEKSNAALKKVAAALDMLLGGNEG